MKPFFKTVDGKPRRFTLRLVTITYISVTIPALNEAEIDGET